MTKMIDIDWLLLPTTLAQLMIATALITFISLLIGPTAPYGRSVLTKNNYSDLIRIALMISTSSFFVNFTTCISTADQACRPHLQ